MTGRSDTSEIIHPSTAPVRPIRLRITIRLALILMMGLLSALLFGLHYIVTSRIVRDFAHVLLDPVASVVTERARDFLALPGSVWVGEVTHEFCGLFVQQKARHESSGGARLLPWSRQAMA